MSNSPDRHVHTAFRAARRRYIAVALAVALLAFMPPSVEAADAPISTGPEVGAPIPEFEARDQHGVLRSFEDLCGPEGLMLLFYRTADW